MIRKKITTLFIAILAVASLFAQTNDPTQQYISRFKKVAMDEMKIYKIPASITLAQGILESGSGLSRLSTKGNNHFGIKCNGGWSGDKIYHDDDEDDECFRVYPSAWGSYRDHSKFLVNNRRYAFLFDYKISDYKSWAYGLKKAGYATDRKYPQRLIDLIERYKLYTYDQMVLNGDELSQEEILASAGPHLELRHANKLDYVIAQSGDTYRSLSMELGISRKRIMLYNDKNWDDAIVEGEIIFIERKRTYGKDSYYKVKKGDTMHSIAQSQGIRLEYLYKRNDLDYGSIPRVGTTLYLKKYK
jgi:LysM repeat protein